ncbi:hypothetical protein SARC_17429, partial [Sphaeroforma arctica JP610]
MKILPTLFHELANLDKSLYTTLYNSLAGTAPNAYTPNEAMLDELAQHTHSNQTWAALADNLTVEYAKLN